MKLPRNKYSYLALAAFCIVVLVLCAEMLQRARRTFCH